MRVIKELQPRYVLGENVNGILSTIHESICADLETEGYEIRTFSIPAYAVGAHHERYRGFIVGFSQGKPGLQANQEANANGAQWETRKHSLLKSWDCLPGTYWATHQPPVCGMANGIPFRMDEYKPVMMALGNAVVPQQIYPLLKAISEIETRLQGR